MDCHYRDWSFFSLSFPLAHDNCRKTFNFRINWWLYLRNFCSVMAEKRGWTLGYSSCLPKWRGSLCNKWYWKWVNCSSFLCNKKLNGNLDSRLLINYTTKWEFFKIIIQSEIFNRIIWSHPLKAFYLSTICADFSAIITNNVNTQNLVSKMSVGYSVKPMSKTYQENISKWNFKRIFQFQWKITLQYKYDIDNQLTRM